MHVISKLYRPNAGVKLESIEAPRTFRYFGTVKTADCAGPTLDDRARSFLSTASWSGATCLPLNGDASTRKYFRLCLGNRRAILMDASLNLESVVPFVRLDEHLRQLGFSAPEILAKAEDAGLLLLEDFGDDTFALLLESGKDAEKLYALAVDVLILMHQHPEAIPQGLRTYHPEKMLDDIELFLEWCTPGISPEARDEFRNAWREVLPAAHGVPVSLLLRDYHVANLMFLAGRTGVRQAGLLDFQDAYQGPVTYDLVSLLQDARRDIPDGLRDRLMARYLSRLPGLRREDFETSAAILAAQRHTRVLAIFERLNRRDGKPDYRRLHTPRVERLLRRALQHPVLARVRQWMQQYARQD